MSDLNIEVNPIEELTIGDVVNSRLFFDSTKVVIVNRFDVLNYCDISELKGECLELIYDLLIEHGDVIIFFVNLGVVPDE